MTRITRRDCGKSLLGVPAWTYNPRKSDGQEIAIPPQGIRQTLPTSCVIRDVADPRKRSQSAFSPHEIFTWMLNAPEFIVRNQHRFQSSSQAIVRSCGPTNWAPVAFRPQAAATRRRPVCIGISFRYPVDRAQPASASGWPLGNDQ